MKMQKKILATMAVCVVFNSAGLKATFGDDLEIVCTNYGVGSETISKSLESYKLLYEEFKRSVEQEMGKICDLRRKEKEMVDNSSVFCPGKSEVEVLLFAKWLWTQIKDYVLQAKKMDFGGNVVECECYDAFIRRICNFGFACIRFSAGRFASEQMLFDEGSIEKDGGKIVDEILTPLHSSLKGDVQTAIFKKSYEEWHAEYKKLIDAFGKTTERESAFVGYLDMMIGRMGYFAHHGRFPRFALEKLSNKDFDMVNKFLGGIKDTPDAMGEKCEVYKKLKKEIDDLWIKRLQVSNKIESNKRQIGDLKNIKDQLLKIAYKIEYDGNGGIKYVMAERGSPLQEALQLAEKYNCILFHSSENKGLEKQMQELTSNIDKLKAKISIEGGVAKILFDFREHNAYLRLFFFCHTLFQSGLRKYFTKENDLTNDFKEEYDSMMKVIKSWNPFDEPFHHSGNVLHGEEVISKEDFLNTESTSFLNEGFMLDESSNQ